MSERGKGGGWRETDKGEREVKRERGGRGGGGGGGEREEEEGNRESERSISMPT